MASAAALVSFRGISIVQGNVKVKGSSRNHHRRGGQGLSNYQVNLLLSIGVGVIVCLNN
jgi:hypothetical protein